MKPSQHRPYQSSHAKVVQLRDTRRLKYSVLFSVALVGGLLFTAVQAYLR